MNIIAVEPIGITPNKAEELQNIFADLGHTFIFYADRKEDPSTLIERVKDADIGIVSNIPLSADILSQCPHLKMLSVAFTGLDHIDLNYCKKQNILVKNASGYATTAVAELTIALILDVYRQITYLDKTTREGGTRQNFLGRQIAGKTVGIIGTGEIGVQTAIYLQALGTDVVAWSRRENQKLIEKGIPYLSLEELLTSSDIISLHLPLTPETKHLINDKNLYLCKKNAIIINTARGPVIDNEALSEALKNNVIAGAGIDVFDMEPPLPKDYGLLSAPNCVLAPHIGYATQEAFEKRIDIVIKNILDYLKNEK